MSANLTLRVVDDLNGEVFGDQARTGIASGFVAGFNFRNTFDYVSDGANETYVLLADTYPTNRGGFTFGWESTSVDTLHSNRNAGVDRRLAGMAFNPNDNTTTSTFRVDLPSAGNYDIRLAMGDTAGNAQDNYLEVRDTTSAVITFAPLLTSSTQMGDALGNVYTFANWPTSNAASTETFATTILRIVLGGSASGVNSSCICHLGIVKV